MAEPKWDARGPVDRYGRPLMPRPEWVGSETPPVEPSPEPPPSPPRPPGTEPEPPPVWTGAADPLPIPRLPITRYSPWRSQLDCGEAAWLAEHQRLGSPISVDQQRKCYLAVKPWSAQALATGVKETELGKTAAGANNVFNLFVSAGTGPKGFPSWGAGAKEWYERLSDPGYKSGVYLPREASIEQIIATYQGGPGCWTSKGGQCANGETWTPCKTGSIELSIQQFVARVNTFMGHVQKVPWSPVAGGAGCVKPEKPAGAPIIYTLKTDYARFGMSQRGAEILRGYCFQNRSGQGVLGILPHVQEGTTPGSLDWWLNGYVNGVKVQASSTVMVQQDGSILRVIDEDDGPWTNGDTCNPTARGQQFLAKCKGGNPNLFSKTLELEGYWNKPHSKEQLDAGAWQIQTWFAEDGLDKDDVYRHGDVNMCTRPNCCGDLIWDGVMARL